MQRAALTVIAVACALLPARAVAQVSPDGAGPVQVTATSRTVAIDFDESDSSPVLLEAITRLVAELRVAGFRSSLPRHEPVAAEGTVPFAAIRLSIDGDRLKVEVSSEMGGTSSQLVLVGRRREVAALALQTAEFLSAELVPRIAAPPTRRPENSSSNDSSRAPANEERSERAQGSWRLHLGAAVLTNLGTGDVLPLLTVHSGFALSPRVFLGGDFHVPLEDARFDATRGSASYRMWLGQLGSSYACVRSPRSALSVGVSAGIAEVSAAGAPITPLEARQPSSWALTLGVGMSSEYRVVDALALVAEARLLTLSPSPIVSVAGDDRRLGHPSALFGVGVEILAE